MKMNFVSTILLLAFVVVFSACHFSVKRENIPPKSFRQYDFFKVKELRTKSPFLKIHMKNGNLYVLESWDVEVIKSLDDTSKENIVGNGALYSPTRELIAKKQFMVGLDSVALLETNVLKLSSSTAALILLTSVNAAFTISCIANPKACFGSCPTFYLSDDDSLRLQAEGFSFSISPSLEAIDIDALYHAQPSNGELLVEMRNEALETHVVRYVNILVVPKQKGTRVFVDNQNQFWLASAIIPPTNAVAQEGDCLNLLLRADGKERFSLANDTYLATKEEVELEFNVQSEGTYGLIIGSRQTLLPTYLLYQTFAYMGNDAGYWLAEIERKHLGNENLAVEHIFGGIDVLLYSPDKEWKVCGTVKEYGPLATDVHLLHLGKISAQKAKLKLRMTQGAWRIDYVALAELAEPVAPIRLRPSSVVYEGQENHNARAILSDSTRVLVTLPGDTYKIKYKLPETEKDFEFFLESRGYYLEWIRKEWIEEENPFLLAEILFVPERALKRLAPDFKRVEAQLEEYFWRSRYAKP
jgi:hypothetical protein